MHVFLWTVAFENGIRKECLCAHLYVFVCVHACVCCTMIVVALVVDRGRWSGVTSIGIQLAVNCDAPIAEC